MYKLCLPLVVWIGLLFATTAPAEMYKYLDEKGQTRWTDDLGQVPVEQRETVEVYRSVKNQPEHQETNLSEEASGENGADEGAGVDEPFEDVSRAALEREKADLDAQYQALTQERQALEETKNETDETTSREDREELNRRIEAYNEKTEQYEERLKQFNEKVNAYNQNALSKPSKED